MKTLKNFVIIVLIMIISGLMTRYSIFYHPIIITLLFLGIVLFSFNLTIRKSLSFRNYFTSPYNLFTTKVRYHKTYDIPMELMFQKIIEVINSSNYKLIEADEKNLEILAISTLSFRSWGENLYINFEQNGNETIMKFCSTTIFQMYSWGKNENNYDDLLSNIEKSFIV